MDNCKSMIIPITGMKCSNCASAIETQVRKLSGVKEASVDFASEKLIATFDSSQLDLTTIINCVKRSGYGIATGKTELQISGLKEPSDSLSLEKDLLKQDGVLASSVNFNSECALVEYVPGIVNIPELI
jgi:P-type Cu+ transporter